MEQVQLVDADQRDGVAVDAGAAGAADAVDVVLGTIGSSKLTTWGRASMSSPRAASRWRRGSRPALLEVGQRADALGLALVAVDGGRLDAVVLELLGEPVGAVLGAREDERLVDPAGLDQMAQQLALALRSTGMTTCVTSSVAVFRGVTWT